jgi:uncharacterized membrane protein YgcG
VPVVPQTLLVQRHDAPRLNESAASAYAAHVFGGMGGNRSTLRMVRLGALVLFLILAATLHGRGSTYNTLHVVYLVIIAGVLIASIATRRRGGGGRGPGGGRFGPGSSRFGGGTFGSGPPQRFPADNPDPES